MVKRIKQEKQVMNKNTFTGRLLLIVAASIISIAACDALEAIKGSPAVIALIGDITLTSQNAGTMDAKKTAGAQEVLRGCKFAEKLRRPDEKAFKGGRRQAAAGDIKGMTCG